MKIKTNKVFADKEIFELFEEVKEKLKTNWVYIHYDVLKALEKSGCFHRYENLKQLNQDGSITKLIMAKYNKSESEEISIYIENCKVGEYDYYFVHQIELGEENIKCTSNPEEGIFYITKQ